MSEADRWREKARATVSGRRFITVGIGTAAMRDFATFGGEIVGAISILPSGGPPFVSDDPFPVLALSAPTRHVFDLVVRAWAPALTDERERVRAFLDRCDPQGTAIVVSYLPVPHEPFGARKVWAQDAAIARALEHKEALGPLLDGALPTVPELRVSWPCESTKWRDASRAFGTDTLVVQRLGLSGGGSATWICPSYEQAMRIAIPIGEIVRLMPFVDGTPCNVMGLVTTSGPVIALPPTRQIVCTDDEGRPVYAGNALGTGFDPVERDAIRAEVRVLGGLLSRAGFTGPFGVDFLRTRDGRRLLHDLNPRMNGAADSLAHHLAIDGDGGPSPLRVLLLARSAWDETEVAAFEAQLDAAVIAHPSVRFLLSRSVAETRTIARAPAAGLWEIEIGADGGTAPTATFVDAKSGFAAVGGTRALLQPTLPPGLTVHPGDRLFVGDLLCAPALAEALLARHGVHTTERLVDAFVGR